MADETDEVRSAPDTWHSFITPRDFPPSSASCRFEVAADSRRGRARPINTDHYLVVQLDRRFETILSSFQDPHVPAPYAEHGYGLVVADGLGDPESAELASRLAIASLSHLGLCFGKWNLRIDEPTAREVMQRVASFYRYVDTLLIHSAGPDRLDLQSTLTAAISAGDQLFVIHVGHSRAYLFREHALVQLTRDHTLAARRVVEPTIVDFAASLDGDHVVLSSLGGAGRGPDVDVERVTLCDGDFIVLTTNGLSDVLPDDCIVEILESDRFLDDRVRLLVETAIGAGADDDATAILARYTFPAPAANGTGKPSATPKQAR